eukprot:TRINITY_DN9125_c0_g1_i1.p1 TRINITY_DN9125_c0_g1~~TRINITY_DN9125_c0_g1_i1.p1  ORF type:complete len:120 (-),score=6.15 TRINITY_DN9125_c0_g1_i1:610-939(-)
MERQGLEARILQSAFESAKSVAGRSPCRRRKRFHPPSYSHQPVTALESDKIIGTPINRYGSVCAQGNEHPPHHFKAPFARKATNIHPIISRLHLPSQSTLQGNKTSTSV